MKNLTRLQKIFRPVLNIYRFIRHNLCDKFIGHNWTTQNGNDREFCWSCGQVKRAYKRGKLI